MVKYTSKKKVVEDPALFIPMTRDEAIELRNEMQTVLGDAISIVIMRLDGQYVIHAIKKGYFTKAEDAEEMVITNRYMWNLAQ